MSIRTDIIFQDENKAKSIGQNEKNCLTPRGRLQKMSVTFSDLTDVGRILAKKISQQGSIVRHWRTLYAKMSLASLASFLQSLLSLFLPPSLSLSLTCTMRPSSTMEDLAVRLVVDLRAPLNTTKEAPVTLLSLFRMLMAWVWYEPSSLCKKKFNHKPLKKDWSPHYPPL